MFKLSRLELSGFKSFVDPAVLDFSGGINAIVGPNGCGKSNVCDAVCWVLGERSAKNLRGETMEDVIFSGSASRKRLGLADVQLSLTTESSYEHAEDGRITIGRRVHRDGESQYLLNGKTVRLKDIRDLLMDTGLGIRAYSVIEQGKIGMILSGKPVERRRLLEEAAGITRYKERRRIAEIKLEDARDNLFRLDDILAEVERSLRSLKRQAGAARRFHERREAYRELWQEVLLGRWSRLSGSLAELETGLRSATDREAESTASVQKLEAELLAGREELDRLTKELAEQHRLEAEQAARIEGRQEFLVGSRSRQTEIDERVKAGDRAALARAGKIETLEGARASLETKLAELGGEHDTAASEVSEDEVKLDEVMRAAGEAESRLEALRGRLLQSIGDVNGLRNQLHREQVELEKGELRERHLAEELAAKIQAVTETTAELETAEARHRELAAAVAEAEDSLAELGADVERRRAALAELESRRSEALDELRALETDRDVLEELERVQAARRRGLTEVFERADLGHPSFLADRLAVPEGWERSLDLYLGALADAIVVGDTATAAVAVNALADSDMTAGLISTDGERPRPVEIDDASVGASLAEALEVEPALAAFLPPAFLVESPDDARRLAAAHPGVSFITRDRFWAEAGVLHIQGRNARPGTLTREHDLNEIRDRIQELTFRRDDLDADIAQQRGRLTEAEATHGSQADKLAETRRELAVAEARRDDLSGLGQRLTVEHDTLGTESTEIGTELGLLRDRSRRLERDLERAQELHSTLEGDFDRAQQDYDRSRTERESTKTSGASRRGRLELISHRVESVRSDLDRIGRDLEEARHADRTWTDDKTRLETRKSDLATAMTTAEEELKEALERREQAQDAAIRQQETIDAHRSSLDEFAGRLEAGRTHRDELREEIAALRVREAAANQEATHLREQYREDFEDELPAAAPEAPEDLERLEMDATRVKEKLDRTGPVNLLAADEYAEQEERHGFLSTQRADVAGSIERLKETIRGINATSSQRFLDTFLQVNDFFGKAFQDLFRGGQAEMRLMDEDEPLECGIEIVARPPGKRLQNIMLMSGGEKALTAIALLFALFRAKPSPFCILDEVDAPLDDLNTLRFVDMLRRMSQETQFIVITHNKLTMEAATRLYGVTMQERGVSRMVSVELDDIHPDSALGA